jgi:hypothetical protein
MPGRGLARSSWIIAKKSRSGSNTRSSPTAGLKHLNSQTADRARTLRLQPSQLFRTLGHLLEQWLSRTSPSASIKLQAERDAAPKGVAYW